MKPGNIGEPDTGILKLFEVNKLINFSMEHLISKVVRDAL